MAEQDEASVNAEKDVILDESGAKKSHWKRHVLLTLLLGGGTWAFWAYAPVAQQFKHNLFGTSVEAPVPAMRLAAPVRSVPQVVKPDVPATPLFENKTILPEVQVEVDKPIAAPESLQQPANNSQLMQEVQQLQTQINSMQQLMVTMQNQQVQQAQMQVRVQLFQLLALASSSKSSIQTMAETWKSIALLPMLTDDKRDYAMQAFEALSGLQQDKEAVLQELAQLTEGMGLDGDVQMVAPDFDTRPSTVAAEESWLDWLFAQFSVRKVMPLPKVEPLAASTHHVGVLLDVQRLQQLLTQETWAWMPDIEVMVHQLDQRGIATNLSAARVADLQQGKQSWQAQAQAWMEQL